MAHWWLLAVLALLALAARETWKIHYGLKSVAWEHATGTLGKVWVEDMPDLQLPQDPFRDEEGTHSVHARYRYRVDGRWYHGRRVSYRATHWIRFREALRMIEGMRAGREVDVFYDPGKPARAVLIPGSSPANAAFLCAYLLVAALLLLMRWWQ
jgi:hypothetical protein